MHPISQQTQDLIVRLYEPGMPLRHLFRPRPDTVELIARIGAAGEPASVLSTALRIEAAQVG